MCAYVKIASATITQRESIRFDNYRKIIAVFRMTCNLGWVHYQFAGRHRHQQNVRAPTSSGYLINYLGVVASLIPFCFVLV